MKLDEPSFRNGPRKFHLWCADSSTRLPLFHFPLFTACVSSVSPFHSSADASLNHTFCYESHLYIMRVLFIFWSSWHRDTESLSEMENKIMRRDWRRVLREDQDISRKLKKDRGKGKDTDKLDNGEDRGGRQGDEEGWEGDVVIGDPALGL